jgi:hypothetical protein
VLEAAEPDCAPGVSVHLKLRAPYQHLGAGEDGFVDEPFGYWSATATSMPEVSADRRSEGKTRSSGFRIRPRGYSGLRARFICWFR